MLKITMVVTLMDSLLVNRVADKGFVKHNTVGSYFLLLLLLHLGAYLTKKRILRRYLCRWLRLIEFPIIML